MSFWPGADVNRASPRPKAQAEAALLALTLGAALVGGAAAALGWGLELAALLAVVALAALGAALPVTAVRGTLLAALLLAPDAATGRTFGLDVHWSQGLTLSNFVLPAVALPLLAGAWLAGRLTGAGPRVGLLPHPWPRFAHWCGWLLAWCLVTLAVPVTTGALSGAAAATVLAHWVKLAFFLALGLAIVDGMAASTLRRVLLWGIAINAGVGLLQAVGRVPVFSPLAAGSAGARATGLFYDANMYGVLAAWALIWLVSLDVSGWSARARWGWALLALAVAGNLVAASSRAGYLALAVAAVVLVARRRWRPGLRAAALLVVLAVVFPARSWQRVETAAATLWQAARPGTVAAANAGEDVGTAARLASLRQGLRQVAAHPVLGLGFGRALYIGVPAIGGGPARGAATFNGAQDMPVTVLAETGPVGLVLFLLMIGAPLKRLWRQHLGAEELALLAGFAGLVAACFTIEALWNARLLALVVLLTSGALLRSTGGAGAGEEVAA